jgi:hypothetical protein
MCKGNRHAENSPIGAAIIRFVSMMKRSFELIVSVSFTVFEVRLPPGLQRAEPKSLQDIHLTTLMLKQNYILIGGNRIA